MLLRSLTRRAAARDGRVVPATDLTAASRAWAVRLQAVPTRINGGAAITHRSRLQLEDLRVALLDVLGALLDPLGIFLHQLDVGQLPNARFVDGLAMG